MAKFKAKNTGQSAAFQGYYRSQYKQRAFPENDSLGPVGVVDFLFAERNLYGRVDQDLNVVIPNTDTIKRLTSNNNPTGVIAMNFVVDQFIDLKKAFQRALNTRKIRQNDPYLSNLEVSRSYINPKGLYESYFAKIMRNFEDNFLDKRKTIKPEDYFSQFLFYIQQITPTFPLTFTAWQRSKNSSIFTSGLALDLSGLDVGNDELKETFIESENFPYFLNACNNFGFSVVKNSPWIIVADLGSPASTIYHDFYSLSSVKQIFSQQFIKTSDSDVAYIKQMLFNSYNNFVDRFNYEKNFTLCNKKLLKNNLYRNNININKFNNIYNNKYFIEYYNNIRYFEEESGFSVSDRNKFTENAKKLEKTFDMDRAIGYINEQYRSVYKSKPGGLNHVLKRAEKKKR